jgi:26S proteasome regulatory subunit N5
MVQQAMEYIDKTPDIETRIELIKTLNSVSAGKVSFVMFEFSIMFYYLLA